MSEPIWKEETRSSIKLRLLVSFAVIAAMAIGSAGVAWLSITLSRQRMETVTMESLPLAAGAQNLSREVALLAVTAAELPRITEEHQRTELLDNLQKRTSLILDQLASLQQSRFELPLVRSLQSDVERLVDNLAAQNRLSQDFLQLRNQLTEAVNDLAIHQGRFNEVARPRIAAEHYDFLLRGRRIGNDVRDYLTSGLSDKEAVARLDEKIRVGFETLISTAVGEMRANLEMVAITFQIVGQLHEAANTDNVTRVEELRHKFEAVQPDVRRIRLILAQSSPENRLILVRGLPIIEHGIGENSIFSIRKRELILRFKAEEYTANTLTLAEKLSAEADSLTESRKKLAASATESLNRVLAKGQYFLIAAVALVIFVSITIGWVYVGRRVIARILTLQKVMERQAAGEDGPIPSDGDDEISAMARSLQVFVEERARVEEELRSAIDSLNETKQIARLGSFERFPATGKWYWSDVFYQIAGTNEQDLPANEENFFALIHPEDLRIIQDLFAASGETGLATTELTVRLSRGDGQVRTVHCYFKDNGKVGTTAHKQWGTVQDVTDRLKMEEEILQARKLESIGVLAGGIAHDFNNILTGILGNLSLAKRFIEPDHKVRQYLVVSEQATLRARDLTVKLLTFAEGGKPVASLTRVPDLLKDVCQFTLAGSNVDFRLDCEESLWPVRLGAEQVSQVVENLVLNADQAMPDGGTIELKCRNIELTNNNPVHLPPGSYLKLSVTDHGRGIRPEHVDKIFDPYFTTIARDSEKGRGLGLAIARSIVTRHNGAIKVTSDAHRGTIFTLYLPAVAGKTGDGGGKTGRGQGPVKRVLVMDDEEMVQNVAAKMLDHLGYTSLLAADGEEAIALYEASLARGENVDVLIMDLTVPGKMGGKEAAKIISSRHPQAKMVVSSGYANDIVVDNYQDYGFCDIISKPYTIDDFGQVIERVSSR